MPMQKWEKMLVYSLLGNLRKEFTFVIESAIRTTFNTENIESAKSQAQSKIDEIWMQFLNDLESGLESELTKPYRSHGYRSDKKQDKIEELESHLKRAQEDADQWKSILEKRLKREHDELIESINDYNKEKKVTS